MLYAAGELYGRLSSQVYLKLMKVAPKSARSYQVMASFAATDGNWKGALDAYRQAAALDPSLVGVHLQIAILLLTNSPDADAWHEALTELNQELKLDPRSAQAEYEIGEVYRKHGQLNEAVPPSGKPWKSILPPPLLAWAWGRRSFIGGENGSLSRPWSPLRRPIPMILPSTSSWRRFTASSADRLRPRTNKLNSRS